MNKTIPLSLMLSITFAMAQEQSKKYLQKKLTVEIQNKIIASYSDLDQWLTESVRVGRANLVIRESRKWEGYKGGFKMSEWDFFRTAGLYQQADASKSYHSTTNCLNWGGLGLTIVGLVITGIGTNWFQEGSLAQGGEGNAILGIGGLSLMGVGITMGVISMTRSKKMFTVSFAIEVAEDYNKRLKKSLE